MSCNGCRVLRKGCSDSCILRPCIQWIDAPQAQGHATLFVAKFFGRAGLMSFISGVPQSQRPALFQSLLFEACGRTVNPVNGAMGLLWTGNWHVCQAAVETVLRGGKLRELTQESSELQETASNSSSRSKVIRVEQEFSQFQPSDLDLGLTGNGVPDNRRPETPSEESVTTTTCFESGFVDEEADKKLLNLFL